MKKSLAILIATFLTITCETYSQESNPKKWGLEVELVQPWMPTAHIFRIQATRTLTKPDSKFRGDLLVGAYIRSNVKHEIVEKINEYLLILGYRQFLLRGLHIEAKTNIGQSWGTRNLIDGKDYKELSWFWEANIGYKFNFLKKQQYNLYIIPQAGILSSISSNIGPRGGRSDTFIHGNLLLGINF